MPLLEKYISGYLSYKNNKEVHKANRKREDHRNLILNVFSREMLREASDEEFVKALKDALSSLWAMHIWRNRERRINRIIERNGVKKLRGIFYDLIYGGAPLEERFDRFLANIWGLGVSSATEILCSIKPDQYAIWNKKAIKALEKLGLLEKLAESLNISQEKLEKHNNVNGSLYRKIIEFFDKELKQEIERIINNKIDFFELDYFFYYVADVAETPVVKESGDAQEKVVEKGVEELFLNINPPQPEPSKETLDGILEVIKESPRHQIILIGPPGTGKTHLAMWVAHKLTDERRKGNWVLVQFHRSYRYDDFIEQVVIKGDGGSFRIDVRDRVFAKLCDYAMQNPDKRFVLVIDEINRADIGSVFGELIYAVEYRGTPVLRAYSGKPLIVPENLYIIATANDIDRGTFDLGVALRRRFEIIRIDSDEEILKKLLESNGASKKVINVAQYIFNKVNSLFEETIGKKGMGYLFFNDVKTPEDLKRVWYYRVKPLVEAYFIAPGMINEKARQTLKNIEDKMTEELPGSNG